MTDQEINVAIAEAFGWTWQKPFNRRKEKNILVSADGKKTCYVWRDGVVGGDVIPDYCHDLNAMHEAVLSLNEGTRISFTLTLLDVLGIRDDQSPEPSEMFDFANAKAHQRAEAFLRTIGKWVE